MMIECIVEDARMNLIMDIVGRDGTLGTASRLVAEGQYGLLFCCGFRSFFLIFSCDHHLGIECDISAYIEVGVEVGRDLCSLECALMTESAEFGHEVGYFYLLSFEWVACVVRLRCLTNLSDDLVVTREALLIKSSINGVEGCSWVGGNHGLEIIVGIGNL